MIERVLGRMPVAVMGSVIKIDQIHCGDARIDERHVVIIGSIPAVHKILAVAQALGNVEDQTTQPGRGAAFAGYAELRITNHVNQDKSLNAAEFTARGKLLDRCRLP